MPFLPPCLKSKLEEIAPVILHKLELEICTIFTEMLLIRFTIRTNGIVTPLITNTSEEFIKCRLDNFFNELIILYYVNFSICENKK